MNQMATHPRPRPCRGYTVLELTVSLGIFAIILIFTTTIMVMTKSAWTSSDAEEDAAIRVRKALSPLERDFSMASSKGIDRTTAGTSLGGFRDGDALWFLSPIDPTTGTFVQDDDGRPVWQRNILYYLSVPANHGSCAGLAGPGGYEQGCPHKVLVRKVINSTGPDGKQRLLKNVSSYLTRPQTESDASSSGPGQESAEIVGTRLLWFRVLDDPSGSEASRIIDARSVAIASAQRVATVKPTGYAEGPYTHFARWPLTARN